MLKVNLENELIKQNKSLVSARELLLINEYDNLGDTVADDETLGRVFGETSAKKGKETKKKIESLLSETKKFNQDRVFHVSQIEKLCKKYHLRFLPSTMFKGSIAKDLGAKINQFEIAYGVTCGVYYSELNEERDGTPLVASDGRVFYYSVGDGLSDYGWEECSTYIAAPASSFQLEERPKDPLLFYKINEEYYALIHKWGNDLSIFRRLLGFYHSIGRNPKSRYWNNRYTS
jgi:hypothetical protein